MTKIMIEEQENSLKKFMYSAALLLSSFVGFILSETKEHTLLRSVIPLSIAQVSSLVQLFMQLKN